jgi:hypothetical protein
MTAQIETELAFFLEFFSNPKCQHVPPELISKYEKEYLDLDISGLTLNQNARKKLHKIYSNKKEYNKTSKSIYSLSLKKGTTVSRQTAFVTRNKKEVFWFETKYGPPYPYLNFWYYVDYNKNIYAAKNNFLIVKIGKMKKMKKSYYARMFDVYFIPLETAEDWKNINLVINMVPGIELLPAPDLLGMFAVCYTDPDKSFLVKLLFQCQTVKDYIENGIRR